MYLYFIIVVLIITIFNCTGYINVTLLFIDNNYCTCTSGIQNSHAWPMSEIQGQLKHYYLIIRNLLYRKHKVA